MPGAVRRPVVRICGLGGDEGTAALPGHGKQVVKHLGPRASVAQHRQRVDIDPHLSEIVLQRQEHRADNRNPALDQTSPPQHTLTGVLGLELCTHLLEHPWCAVRTLEGLSLIHISEPTRRTPISYAVFC